MWVSGGEIVSDGPANVPAAHTKQLIGGPLGREC